MKIEKDDKCSFAGTEADSDSTVQGYSVSQPIRQTQCCTLPFSRHWGMPNKNTFDIKPIKAWVEKYWNKDIVSIDPFARNTKYATYRNDLNPETEAEYHLHACDFINKLIADGVKADLVFFDPPYSPHQTKECYLFVC